MNTDLKEYRDFYTTKYSSSSQLARVITEKWFEDNMYCPFCASDKIYSFSNNYPVADFYCKSCKEEFQLKSKKNSIGKSVTDGEYNKMMDAIQNLTVPNFFFLNYSNKFEHIVNLMIVPKLFMLPNVIQKRKPLSNYARRAGWTGCNILLKCIPDNGKVFAVKDGNVEKRERVINNLLSIEFLRNITNIEARSWLKDILLVISEINSEIFNLKDVYKYMEVLKKIHPDNNNIDAKIRQQLQILRDNGVLEFLGNGVYKKI